MKKIYKSKNGFTLVELLAVIVIIGIIAGISIVAVMRYIEKARAEQIASQEKTLAIAAKQYLQDNRGLLPKNIGDTTKVTAQILKDNRYLTDDIRSSKKGSCTSYSFVTAKKESQTKYSYKAYIYCEKTDVPTGVAVATPEIVIDFVDENGVSYKQNASVLEDVSQARFIIDFRGGKDKEVSIEGYSYSILVDPTGGNNLREVYSSGTLSANYATAIHVDKNNNLADYIDITGKNTVAIKATVRNVEGGISHTVDYFGDEYEENTQQPAVVYNDNKPPICVPGRTVGALDDNDSTNWINANSEPGAERKVRVECDDGNGSGCVRSTFTKTWDGSEAYEYDYIQIKDNAGNTNDNSENKGGCIVRVNIDKVYPVIDIDAFPKDVDDVPIEGSESVLTGTKSTSTSSDSSVTINSDEYLNLYSGYMNKANYPNGIIYKVTIKDSLIKSWTWEVNAKEIETRGNNSGYEDVSMSGSEAASGDCGNKKECTFYLKLYDNGLRKGVLTVSDKAGNVSKYTIYADINRQVPEITSIINSSSNSKTGAWTRDNVYLDIESKLSKTKVAIGDYYYSYKKNAKGFSLTATEAGEKWVRLSGGTGLTSFRTSEWDTEINKKIYLMVCDISGNCSDVNDEISTYIRIDRTAPTGLKLTGYKKTSTVDLNSVEGLNLAKINSNEWYNNGVIVIPSDAIDAASGEVSYYLTVTGASANVVDPIEKNYRNVNADGTSTVTFMACDKANNCSAPKDFIVKIDKTGPTIPTIVNLAGINWSTEKVKITVGSTDALTGIDKYYYSYSTMPVGYGNNPVSQWVEMTEGAGKESFDKEWSDDINKIVYIIACDKLGNCSEPNSTVIKIDAHPPTKPQITNEHEGVWAQESYSLQLESSDAGSGLREYQYTYNANATEVGDDAETQWKSDVNLATNVFTTEKISLEQDRLMYWRACDFLGNCSEKSSTRIKIDKTKPTCGTITASTNNSESGVSGTLACEDSVSGCVKNSYPFGPLTVTDTIKIKDSAGNQRTCTIPVRQDSCTISSDWAIIGLFSSFSNYCPSDDVGWDRDFTSCTSPDLYSVCTSECNDFCSSNPAACGLRVCCVERSIATRTCYVINTSE